MNFDIQDNSILIVPNSLKFLILKDFNEKRNLLNIKYMSREEFIAKRTFSYGVEAVLYLMDKYHYDAEVCQVLLNNMRYVKHNTYTSDKLNHLFDLKEELLEYGLLEEDSLFNILLNNKKIYVYGYRLDSFFSSCLVGYNYELLNTPNQNINNKIVYEASTLEEEVSFVFDQVAQLITKGISISQIKIVNYSSKYDNVFKKLSKFYHIPLMDQGHSIYSTNIVKEYLKILSESKDFLVAYNHLKDKYDGEPFSKILSLLLNISNKYNDLDYSFESIYTLVKNDLKNSLLVLSDDKNCLSFTELNPYLYHDDDYVFLIGFNQNELPKLYKDEDYITDNEKELIGLEKTSLKNKLEKEKVLYFISNVKNLTMSYSLKHLQEVYYPSNLISENLFEVQKVTPALDNYAHEYALIKLTKYLDDFVKYGTISPFLSKYYSNYQIPYLTYNNKFTGLDKNKLLQTLNNKLLLSYSAINTYNKCHFRYYIENILKINKYEENFSIKIGNLFHYLLSICLNDSFDLTKEWDNYVKALDLNSKEEVLLEKLKDELSLIIDVVKKLHHETYLTNYLMEKEIYINKNNIKYPNIDIKFKGVIDKCMYREKDGQTLVSIIDYKTGNPNIKLDNVAYGIDMQLPIYWYLIKKGSLFKQPKFVGFYLQKILHGELKRDFQKKYCDVKIDQLKLVGYSTTDKMVLESFDPTFENSSYISGMRLKKDGEFYNYTKVLSDDILDELVNYIDKIIDENAISILNSDFTINPKQIGLDLIGCNYCQYRDLCYRHNEDIDKVKAYHDLSFLGGDTDA